jgi:predicted DCC family thiol-disulfide oxidoreductase YuxK
MKRELNNHKELATLIYDGKCPVCSGTVKWISEHEISGSFEMVACQSEKRGALYPEVNRSDCMTAMHLVLPDGTVLVGEQALPRIVSRLRGYRFAAPLFRLPGARALSRIAYRWFADRRYRITTFLSHLADGRQRVAQNHKGRRS